MAGKRFLTLHGIPIPPWKEQKLGAGATTIRFVIRGTIPSKKNNEQAVTVRKDAYKMLDEMLKSGKKSWSAKELKAAGQKLIKACRSKMRPNAQYLAFAAAQKPILQEQCAFWIERLQDKGLTFPLTGAQLQCRFYFAHRYRQDSLNKQQSVQDLLKECSIIVDDDYTCVDPTTGAGRCYYEEITENLCVIALTFSLRP